MDAAQSVILRCTYTNQIIALFIDKRKELLNCFCSRNNQCHVVLQHRMTGSPQCKLCRLPLFSVTSPINPPTHLVVKHNIIYDFVDTSKTSLTVIWVRVAVWQWSTNNLHSVSFHILLIWWGTQAVTHEGTQCIAHRPNAANNHPWTHIYKWANTRTPCSLCDSCILCTFVSFIHTQWQKALVAYLGWDHCWQSPIAIHLWSSQSLALQSRHLVE